jgi:hypothetical protein
MHVQEIAVDILGRRIAPATKAAIEIRFVATNKAEDADVGVPDTAKSFYAEN